MGERRNDGERHDQRGDQRIGLGEGEGPEKASGLPGKGEDGEEGNHGGEHRGENRSGHLVSAAEDDRKGAFTRFRLIEMFEDILGENDADIDHGADRDGDSRESHHVRIHPREFHGDEGDQHCEGQHGADQNRGPQVQDHDDDHDDGDEYLLEKRVLEGAEGLGDEARAVVEGDHRDLGSGDPPGPSGPAG